MIRRRAANPAPLAAPEGERFPAAVLLADVSGFTALAERLARKGPAGAEELTAVLNAYFGQLIGIVDRHGGQVFKFAGDALLVLWPKVDGSDGDLATLVGRAAACGLAMQQDAERPEVEGGTRLALRVAIGAGEMVLAHIGGVLGRWEYTVTGAPLGDVGAVLHAVDPGQVAMATNAWLSLRESNQSGVGVPLPGGGVRLESLATRAVPAGSVALPEVSPEAESALHQYLPGAIRSRVEAGQAGWLAELRNVTVLFLNLPDLHHETPLEEAHEVLRTLQRALYRFEGSINKLSVDDKGVSLVAATGLPPLSHEDDAVRGVRAALAMRAALEALGLRAAIGVATGRAFCGEVGNARRREYTMIGDVVNLAARLMQAAGDGILCDEITHQAARGRIRFEELAPIAVKGKTGPVGTYRPAGTAEGQARRKVQIVGRQAERGMLGDHLKRVLRGDSSAVIVEGEGGIGKSRLVESFIEQAAGLNIAVLVGAGDAIEKTTPYHAWRTVFARAFGLEEAGDDLAAWRERTIAHLRSNPEWDRLAPLATAILPLDLPDTELTAQMTGLVRADNTCDLLVSLLQAHMGSEPLVLILEDVHWFDSASLGLARAIWRRVQPLLIVLATRPMGDSPPAEFRQIQEHDRTRFMKLDVLPAEDMRAVVANRLCVDDVPDAIVSLIQDRAGGHPFFATELASALLETRAIAIEGRSCRVAANLQELRLPDTVQGVITSRVDRLLPAQQLTLKVASVIGRVFAFRILRDIHPIVEDRPALPDHMAALERLDLTPVDTPEPDLAYLFKHVITQQVVYDLLPLAKRRQVHRTIAEWHERRHESALGPCFSLLAHHWELAGDESAAIRYLDLAGRESLEAGAFREAIGFLEKAQRLQERGPAEAPEVEAKRHRRLGEAHYSVGSMETARNYLERALALLGWPVPASRTTLLASIVLECARQAVRRFSTEANVSASTENAAEACVALMGLIRVYYIDDDPLSLLLGTLRSLNLAEKAGLLPEMARGYAAVSFGLELGLLPGLSDRYRGLALRTLQAVEDLHSRAWVHQIAGLQATGRGKWDQAEADFLAAIEHYEEHGDSRGADECRMFSASTRFTLGDLAGYQAVWTNLKRTALNRGDAQHLGWALMAEAQFLALRGRTDEAAVTLAEAMSSVEGCEDRKFEIFACGVRARILLQQGRTGDSLKAAARGVGLLEQGGGTSAGFSIFEFALVPMDIWEDGSSADPGFDSRELRRLVRRASRALRRAARVFPASRPAYLLCLGRFRWLLGLRWLAIAALRKAVTAAETLRSPYEQGLALSALGQRLPADHHDRRQHLDHACAILERVGAAWDLARAREALEATSSTRRCTETRTPNP